MLEKKAVMTMNSVCADCILSKQLRYVKEFDDEVKKTAFIREMLADVAATPTDMPMPAVTAVAERVYEKYYGRNQYVESCRWEFNKIMLALEDKIDAEIKKADDELLQAMRYCMAANYIDTGTLANVDPDKLKELMDEAAKRDIDAEQYEKFIADLSKAKKLVYLHDNSGEIVADKLLLRRIHERFPDIELISFVRGMPTLNDATIEDAEYVGLTKEVRVIPNGTDIPGTELELITEEARKEFLEADVIVSKGLGNFESIFKRGFNVYYLFLCKCEWFETLLGIPRMEGVFVHEASIKTVPGMLTRIGAEE